MAVTIEIKPEVEKLLRLVAKERGVALEEVLSDRLSFSAEELEEGEIHNGKQRSLSTQNTG